LSDLTSDSAILSRWQLDGRGTSAVEVCGAGVRGLGQHQGGLDPEVVGSTEG
jgi:hypothetical protein